MKKIFSVLLTAALALSLVACGSTASSSEATVKDYAAIITETRPDDYNEAHAIVADGVVTNSEGTMSSEDGAMYLQDVLSLTGLDANAMQHYALSVSMRNTNAYCAAIILPVEGHEEDITTALQNYVSFIQKSFEHYLPDQYEISRAPELRTAKSGEIVFVMAENATDVADAIEAKLAE